MEPVLLLLIIVLNVYATVKSIKPINKLTFFILFIGYRCTISYLTSLLCNCMDASVYFKNTNKSP